MKCGNNTPNWKKRDAVVRNLSAFLFRSAKPLFWLPRLLSRTATAGFETTGALGLAVYRNSRQNTTRAHTAVLPFCECLFYWDERSTRLQAWDSLRKGRGRRQVGGAPCTAFSVTTAKLLLPEPCSTTLEPPLSSSQTYCH